MALRDRAVRALLDQARDGRWEGELSSSALSTATAACALALYERAGPGGGGPPMAGRPVAHGRLGDLVGRALAWIAAHGNPDGGWGDTTGSPSNLSTTLLCWAALGADPARGARHAAVVAGAEAWLRRRAGGTGADQLARAVLESYGDDRTFSIPILTMCALSGRFGRGVEAWRRVKPVPFELAAVPHRWLDRLGLPMVSYALPALIAVGQVGHVHRPSRNPVWRALRDRLRRRTLAVLERIQPASGGFLEAAPLTSFVVMSLVGSGEAGHPVAERGIAFLASTVRGDGSWPIDTNLSTWLTTTAVQSLAAGGRLESLLSEAERSRVLSRLLDEQSLSEHPYTHAAPGGWAWTDLSGGVPDADDTSGALLAAWALAPDDVRVRARAALGVRWLLDLQNRDGGVPTFCRGWTRLPFDHSSPDITAHALRAWTRWRPALGPEMGARVRSAEERARRYLVRAQRRDGAWVPLWFGNQHAAGFENPVYGTARVLLAGKGASGEDAGGAEWRAALERGRRWLLSARNADGGWGGGAEPSSVEETALAVEALALRTGPDGRALEGGLAWLRRATEGGTRFEAAPIGLYFARLWYSERLYPLLFSVAALERACLPAAAAALPDPEARPREVPA